MPCRTRPFRVKPPSHAFPGPAARELRRGSRRSSSRKSDRRRASSSPEPRSSSRSCPVGTRVDLPQPADRGAAELAGRDPLGHQPSRGLRAAARAAAAGDEGDHRHRRHLAAAAADAHARRAPARCSRSCCELLADSGVDDVHLVIAIALHRRMTEAEMRRMVGDEDLRRLLAGPATTTTTPRSPAASSSWAPPRHGEKVAARTGAPPRADLVIYVNLNLVPMDGGHKSVGTGLTDYAGCKAHHTPQRDPRARTRYMEPKRSELHQLGRSHRPRDRPAPERLPHRDGAQQPDVRRAAGVPQQARGGLHRGRSR